AALRLGEIYEKAIGVKKDYPEAVKWYRQAAKKGSRTARSALDLLYDSRKGLTADRGQWCDWFRTAAAAGDRSAQHALGVIFVRGELVDCDYSEAKNWFLLAASDNQTDASPIGHDLSQLYLGYIFYCGHGTEQNMDEAIKWFCASALQQNENAMLKLYEIFAKGRAIKQNWQETPIFDLCNHLYNQLIYRAEAGEVNCKMGEIYYHGHCIKQNYDEASNYFNRSAQQNFPRADYYLAMINEHQKNYKKAHDLLLSSAESGCALAQFELGKRFKSEGMGGKIEIDPVQAFNWFKKAANQGHVEAQYSLYDMQKGAANGVEQNLPEAYQWLYIATEMTKEKEFKQNYNKDLAEFSRNSGLTPTLIDQAEKAAHQWLDHYRKKYPETDQWPETLDYRQRVNLS
ncbi:MAG: tetratricopeptide repeat protein, partial [Candidatus Pacebacteria bacterium]|nr:tetratricopeptide repeat protein [Candidatus Paceibacterota bacterium]